MLYHVRLTIRGQRQTELSGDLDEDTMESRFLVPYREGRPITVNGKVVPLADLDRIRISASEWPLETVAEQIRLEDQSSRVAMVGGPSVKARAAARAHDVTDQYITGPPGSAQSDAPISPPTLQPLAVSNIPQGPGDGRSVFVITGRDHAAYSGIVELLRALALRVVEWETAVARTGLPSPYVGDVVLTGLSMADVALVLFTPDDIVQLRPDLQNDDDGEGESKRQGQARPNVFYEAGIADALGRERTVLVEVGPVKAFSDAAGRHMVRYDGSPSKRNALVGRLQNAGLSPDTSGSAWLSAGDVTSSIDSARAALSDEATNV